MIELWLPLKDIPAEGREYVFDDPDFWSGAWSSFGLPYAATEPVSAVVRLLMQDEGCLVTGTLTGAVRIPCDRCAGDALVTLDERFEEFEEMPGDEAVGEADESRIREQRAVYELDMGSLLWEQFVLALPVHPLCSDDCKGLCPKCGADLNQGECGCDREAHDPRLAALRNLKVNR